MRALPGEPPSGPSRVPVTHLEKGQRKNPPRASRSASQPCHPFGSAKLGARNLLLPRRRRLVASPVPAGSRDAAAHGGPLVASLTLADYPEAPGKFPAGRTRTEPRGGLQARRGSCHSLPALARRLGPLPGSLAALPPSSGGGKLCLRAQTFPSHLSSPLLPGRSPSLLPTRPITAPPPFLLLLRRRKQFHPSLFPSFLLPSLVWDFFPRAISDTGWKGDDFLQAFLLPLECPNVNLLVSQTGEATRLSGETFQTEKKKKFSCHVLTFRLLVSYLTRF